MRRNNFSASILPSSYIGDKNILPMHMPSAPANEKERLAALRDYQILDTGAEPEFDEIAGLASEICQVPTSIITLIDQNRTWIKSSRNFDLCELPRETVFFEYAIRSPHEPIIVTDMRGKDEFKDLPFVKEDPHFVFYSGVSLINPEGFVLGTLCVMDKQPGKLSGNQLWTLQILAAQIIHLLELRKAHLRIKSLQSDLESQDEEFQQFAYTISHDIKSPLASIILTSEMIRENFGDHLDEDNDQLLNVLNRSSLKIRTLVDGILAYYRAGLALADGPESFGLKPFLISIAEMLNIKQNVHFHLPERDCFIFTNKTALEQILVNLFQNVIDHNDKDRLKIKVRFSEQDDHYHFIIVDNGKGMGTGFGVSIVKRLVEKLSGTILMKSVPGEGSEFSFSIKKKK
jgi:hypothetical protein